jgi:hypothetical protein
VTKTLAKTGRPSSPPEFPIRDHRRGESGKQASTFKPQPSPLPVQLVYDNVLYVALSFRRPKEPASASAPRGNNRRVRLSEPGSQACTATSTRSATVRACALTDCGETSRQLLLDGRVRDRGTLVPNVPRYAGKYEFISLALRAATQTVLVPVDPNVPTLVSR